MLKSPFLPPYPLQWEGKVEEGQKNFDKASKMLKKEVKTFEVKIHHAMYMYNCVYHSTIASLLVA